MKFDKPFFTFCFLIIISSISFAQQTGEPKIFRNTINISPIGMVLNNYYVGNYEHLFGNKTGIMIQGGRLLGTTSLPGMAFEVHYRYHYFRKINQTGLNSPFFGLFVCYTNRRLALSSTPSDSTVIDAEWFKIGANWGRKWIWSNSLNLAFRIGYGIPIFLEYKWLPEKPSSDAVDEFERVSKLGAGLDAELSLGFAF